LNLQINVDRNILRYCRLSAQLAKQLICDKLLACCVQIQAMLSGSMQQQQQQQNQGGGGGGGAMNGWQPWTPDNAQQRTVLYMPFRPYIKSFAMYMIVMI